MKIIGISDTHGRHHNLKLPDGDMIIHTGDISSSGSFYEIEDFVTWFESLNYTYKIFIAGNHDWGLADSMTFTKEYFKNRGIIYLNDDHVTIKHLKIFGSPVQPAFCNWAFNRSRTKEEALSPESMMKGHSFIGTHWNKIPSDTNILITHGPPAAILDETVKGDCAGCKLLLDKTLKLKQLKLHLFGHIHEDNGILKYKDITYSNISSLDEYYNMYKTPYKIFNL